MRVLITGGAGFIGSHTNRYFSEQGVETFVLDDLSAGHKESVVVGKFIKGSFGDKKVLRKILSKKIDAIVHFGAFADVADSVANPAKYYQNNVTNMLALLECAAEFNVSNFVFSSSAATFGEPETIPIDEKHPQKPINSYGMTKLIGEKMLSDFEIAYGIHFCALRYFNAAGASKDCLIGESHTPEHHIIPLVLEATEGKGKGLKVFGDDYDTRDGSCLRDYIHVDDLADAHWRGLQYIMKEKKSECFNMGSGSGTTVLELIHSCENVTGMKVPYTLSGRRPGDPAKLVASNEKVRTLLGWEPRNGLDEILFDAWNWYRNKKF